MLRFEKDMVYPKMIEVTRMAINNSYLPGFKQVRRDANKDTYWYAPWYLAWLYRLLPRWIAFRKIPPERGVGYFTTAITANRWLIGLVDRGTGTHFLIKLWRWELRTWPRDLWNQIKRPVLEYEVWNTDGNCQTERAKTYGPAPKWKPITIERVMY